MITSGRDGRMKSFKRQDRMKLAVLLAVLVLALAGCQGRLFIGPFQWELNFGPTPTVQPTYTIIPTYTPRPTYTPMPTYTPLPTYTYLPTQTETIVKP